MSNEMIVRICYGCGMTTAADLDATVDHEEEMQLPGQTVRRVPLEEGLRLWKAAGPCSCKGRKSPTGTEAKVCADIARRQQLGVSKYGTTVADNPLTLKRWLQHAYEECLDQAVYLKRAIEQIEWKGAMSTMVDKQADATASAVVLGERRRRYECQCCGTWYDQGEPNAENGWCCGHQLTDKTNG